MLKVKVKKGKKIVLLMLNKNIIRCFRKHEISCGRKI